MIEGTLFNHLTAIEHLKYFIKLNGEKSMKQISRKY